MRKRVKSAYLRPRELRRRSSRTAGKDKGDNCKKTPNKVLFIKDTRLHKKDPALYDQIWQQEFAHLHK